MSRFSFFGMMNVLAQYGIALLVFCCVMYFMMNSVLTKFSKQSDVKFQNKMQELQSSISTIQTKQDAIIGYIDEIEKDNTYISNMIIENSNKIDQNNKSLNNLKKQYHETIRNVDTYTVSDLDSIFSKKYGKNFIQK
jgi:lipopolysaccharide export LptBFGC system permease protein LptF